MTSLAALGGGLLISFAGIFFVLSETSAFTGAFFRALYAIPVLVVLFLVVRRNDHRKTSFRLLALGSGAFLGADLLSWNAAIGQIGAGLATLVVNTSVVFVALGAWAIFGERPSRTTAFAIPVILIGIGFVSGVGQGEAFGESPLLGTLLALMGAVFYAAFFLGFRQANKDRAPGAGPLLEATVGVLVITSLIGIPAGAIDFEVSWPSHGWLLAMAVGAQVAGWLLIGYALPRLPAAETATIILLQPAMTMGWAAIFLDERPSALQIMGAVIVLAGVAFVTVVRTKRDRGASSVSTTEHQHQ